MIVELKGLSYLLVSVCVDFTVRLAEHLVFLGAILSVQLLVLNLVNQARLVGFEVCRRDAEQVILTEGNAVFPQEVVRRTVVPEAKKYGLALSCFTRKMCVMLRNS